jgi:hypothetical protein
MAVSSAASGDDLDGRRRDALKGVPYKNANVKRTDSANVKRTDSANVVGLNT